jgi:hypothetical protein
MSNLWDWYERYIVSIIERQSPSHMEMLRLYNMAQLASDSHSLSLLRQARDRADALNETCFSLFLSHWITEHLLWRSQQYTEALKNALEAVVVFRRQGSDCPLAERLYINLVEAYIQIDPGGYRPDIEESLAYVRDHVSMDYEGHCMMAFRRGLMHARLGEWDAATTSAEQCLSHVEDAAGPDYYRAIATFVLGLAAFHTEDHTRLGDLALIGAIQSQNSSPPVYMAEFAMWSAYAAMQSDDPEHEVRYQRAAYLGETLPDMLTFAYYDAQVAYLTARDDLESALAVRETQREKTHRRGGLLDNVEAGLSQIDLTLRLGRPVGELAGTVRADINTLREPEPYHTQLTTLLADQS